jgi:hypothetical protein
MGSVEWADRVRVGLATLVVALVLAVMMVPAVATGAGASTDPAPPAVSLPDPFVVTTSTGYVAFGTNTGSGRSRANIPMLMSADLADWVSIGDALPTMPIWASSGATWSPSVRVGPLGDTLYFTATERRSGRQCIGSATAPTLTGPYHPAQTPIVCQVQLGGDIDPEVFTASNGTTWLLWKSDGNCCDQPVSIWSQQLDATGRLTGGPTRLLSATEPWEHGVIENPTMVEHDGRFVLEFSAGQWNSSNYGTGAALCPAPDRPCTLLKANGPTLQRVENTVGDGGASFFVDRDGIQRVAFHAWVAGQVGRGTRNLWTAAVDWFGDVPVLTGAARLALVAPPVVPTTSTTVVSTTTTTTTTTAPPTTAPMTPPPRPAGGTTEPVVGAVAMTPVRSTRSSDGPGSLGVVLTLAAGLSAGGLVLARARRGRADSGVPVRGTTGP